MAAKDSTSAGENFDVIDVTANSLEPLLDEDATFIDFFNAFLALPTFPVRLHYNGDTGCFEEFKHKLADDVIDNNAKQAALLKKCPFFKSTIDERGFKIGYYVKFLERDEGITWIKENRLPLFLRSDLYAEYKLARFLSIAQTDYLVNILVDWMSLQKAAFDSRSFPAYRVRRNHGRLPGLAEFQKQLQSLKEDHCDESVAKSQDSSCDNESDVSDLEVPEVLESHARSSISLESKSNDARESESRPMSQSFRRTALVESKSNNCEDVIQPTGENCGLVCKYCHDESEQDVCEKGDAEGCNLGKCAHVTTKPDGVSCDKPDGVHFLSMLCTLRKSYSEVAGQPKLAFLENDPQPESENEPQPESENDPQPESENGPQPESENDPQPESENEPQPESEIDPQPESENEPQPESEIDPQPESENDPQPESEIDPKPESENDPQPESEIDPQPESEINPQPESTREGVSLQKRQPMEGFVKVSKTGINFAESRFESEEHFGQVIDSSRQVKEHPTRSPASKSDLDAFENVIGQSAEIHSNPQSIEACIGSANVSPACSAFENKSLADAGSLIGPMGTEHRNLNVKVSESTIETRNVTLESLGGTDFGELPDDNFEHNIKTRNDSSEKDQVESQTAKRILEKRYSLPFCETSNLRELKGELLKCGLENSRRQSLPFASFLPFFRQQSTNSISSNESNMRRFSSFLVQNSFELLDKDTQDTLRSFYQDSDSDDGDDHCGQSESKTRKPIDIATKLGMDAFKFFLANTHGEKLFMLWIEIEKLKCCGDATEQHSMLQEIRQRFFRSGSAHEITTATLNSWNITKISDIDRAKLFSIQSMALTPLKSYWCARFTLHQKHRQHSHETEFISEDHNCMKTKCTTHNKEMTDVPQRPNTCFPNMRTRKEDTGTSSKSLYIDANHNHTTGSSSHNKRTRSKSAYSRLVTTPNPKDVNLSQKQLQMVTTMDESCGFRYSPYSLFKNDASSSTDKAYIRLYIQPMPPANCRATTVVRSGKKLQNDGGNGNLLTDSLVDCLMHEKHSGSYFFRQLRNQDDEHALNCYNFWKAIQDYSEHFFSESFSATLIKQKAGLIFNTYIIDGSDKSIRCAPEIRKEIYDALDPPYEDLFDQAEQYALEVLSHAYKNIFSHESDKYEQVKKIEKLKHLDIRSKLKRPKHRPYEKTKSKDTEEEDSHEKISVDEVNVPLPMPLDGITFESFVRNRNDLESFKEFLEHVHSKGLKDLLAWMEMENFRRSSRRNSQRDNYARSVNSKWLTNDYFFGPNSPATKEAQQEVHKLAGEKEIPARPPSPMILEAQKYVKARIERRWFVLFKESSSFQSKHKENNITEMVEDLIMKRRMQRSEAAWKILNSRWISGSRDVIALRQLLMDPIKCQQFRQFLSLKGDLMEHNVYFWLEVQKYKELCHRHVEDAIIKSKVQAVVDVFIKSAVPPELQIDVPIEIAERLHEKTNAKTQQYGPYLFREAQTTVFRIMFNHWKEYVSFRASMEEHRFAQHLEELVKKRKAELRAKRMNSERRRLVRAAYEKKKREREDNERFKGKEHTKVDFSSYQGHEKALSLISEDEEAIMQVTSFSYSKFTAEEQLSDYEQRMREEGCTLDEYTEGDFTSHLNSEKKSYRRASGLASDEGRSVSGISVRVGRKKSGGVSRINVKNSVVKETIYESANDSSKRKTFRDVIERKCSNNSIKSFSSRAKSRNHFKKETPLYGSNIDAQDGTLTAGKNAKINEQSLYSEGISVSSKISKSRFGQSLMPGPRRTGASLTMKCLREFDKSSDGRPIKAGLPLIHINGIDKATREKGNTHNIQEQRRPSSAMVHLNSERSFPVQGRNKAGKERAANDIVTKIIVT